MSKAVADRRAREFFELASPETKQLMGRIAGFMLPAPDVATRLVAYHRSLREEYESWERALRGDTSKLEARIRARIATDEELELICDLVAGRVRGKQYLKRLGEETTRAAVEGYFLDILANDPHATMTKAVLFEAKDRFRVSRSLAAEIWGKVKREIAESTQA
jgi:hypothetical protein